MTKPTPRRRSDDKTADKQTLAQSMEIARTGSVPERCALAARLDVPPELLFFLAEDSDRAVRRVVAANINTPRQADDFLAQDDDEGVRCAVAEKIGVLAPDVVDERRGPQRQLTINVLEALALDAAVKVRARLAESIKDVDSAPPEVITGVIQVLARDAAIEVAGPVLEHSSLLSDEFLVDVISAPSHTGSVSAISRRQGVSSKVTDAIATSGDDAAIAVLLGNESAQIREETLDRLIEGAPQKPSWHAPLVARPKLAGRQIGRLSEFVASALVEQLARRSDLDPETSKHLQTVMAQRLEETVGTSPQGTGLSEDDLVQAVASGRRAKVISSLAVRTGYKEPIVHSILNSGSAKAVIALSWKAGLSMSFAEQLQLRLAYIAERDMLRGVRGSYPLSEEDMLWQLGMFDGGQNA
ncbi:DUF2336 domain-containing protein [Thalassobaculum sp. OXR-137]|uniref:DUF2336 domain-containing protein n=1 Tax=Thalassobaculum sp. OXR-137 TaxID=3100173 RepID=UPI002AC8CFF1|nr:DUF2336 domain-containing protein [Thalassobaculum sp. OXR-137]WPZ34953.1 DUF2336 domain-containing protein [Thalassobaculum sp. OXR-137]